MESPNAHLAFPPTHWAGRKERSVSVAGVHIIDVVNWSYLFLFDINHVAYTVKNIYASKIYF